MKVLVFPRDRNPYQRELYKEMARGDVRVRYAGELTASQTVNMLLLPVEMALARAAGYRLLHLHWVYPFALPFAARVPRSRRLMRAWFSLTLFILSALRIRIVWIAHNLVPHESVFDDDVAARRVLIRAASAIVAHSSSILTNLQEIAELPKLTYILRHPSYNLPTVPSARTAGPLRVLFFGSISVYKGVPDLLAAVSLTRHPVEVTVAGECPSRGLSRELFKMQSEAVRMSLRRQTDAELFAHLVWADVVALPFKTITTSGSVLYALSAGRPVIIPDLPTLRDLPDEAVIRFTAGQRTRVHAIASALDEATIGLSTLAQRGSAGRAWANGYKWSDLARDLHAASRECLSRQ